MAEKLTMFLLNNSNKKTYEITMKKPKTYEKLLHKLSKKFQNIKEEYEIFILKNNEEIIIDNDEKLKSSNDIMYIRKKNEICEPNNPEQKSMYEINYDKLSVSDKEILDEKFNCFQCNKIIKNEKPYLCYKCQKIFHENCLKNWYVQRSLKGKRFTCPNCNADLPLGNWSKKLDFEEDRKNMAIIMDKLNKNDNTKNKKLKLFDQNELQKYELMNSYNKYLEESSDLISIILEKTNIIHSLLEEDNYNNDKINNLIKELSNNPPNTNQVKDLSNLISEELNIIEKLIKKKCKKIFIIYNIEEKGKVKIFNEIFVKNNFENINLTINGIYSSLVEYFELEKGENSVELIILNTLTNLNHMFSGCNSLVRIEVIEYLDVKSVIDMSFMFFQCSSLSDIKGLEKWDVSNVCTFENMFEGCSSLTDIKSLKEWNVSNGENFSGLFSACSSLSNISALETWDISNATNLENMFRFCRLLSDISPLKNWDVSNVKTFKKMFSGCSSLSNIIPLKNWNVSNGLNFNSMFSKCSSISDIIALKNWNVSKGNNFYKMFYKCTSLINLIPIQHWNIPDIILIFGKE